MSQMAWTPSAEIIKRSKTIDKILRQNGYSKTASAGILGNLIVETAYTLSPTINENGGGGYGLGQWTPKENVYIQGKMLGLSRAECDTLDGQAKIIAKGDVTGQWMNYTSLVYPGNPRNPLTLADFKKATNLNQATAEFMQHWERPSEIYHHYDRRVEAANAIIKHLDGTGGGGSSEKCYGVPIPNTNIDPSSFMTGQLFGHTRPGWETGDFHNGLDFGSIDHPGSEMIAVIDGVVTHVGNMSGLRAYVVINDGEYNIVYQEFSYNTGNIKVRVGDRVKKGQLLAIRDADHLHLGFTKVDFMTALGSSFTDDGTWEDPLNFLGKCVDGGGLDPEEPGGTSDDYITLLLVDALNGWKY